MVYSEYTSTGQMLENELKAQRTEVAAVKSKKDTDFIEALMLAQAAVFPEEELKIENFNRVNTEGFEKAVVLLKCWAEMTMREMFKKRNFRIEINYNAEAQKVDFAIYTPTEHAGENSKPEHSEN